MRKIKHALHTLEENLADIASPLVWLFSSAPETVKNAITALMPALVILFVFHSLLICSNAVGLHDLIGLVP